DGGGASGNDELGWPHTPAAGSGWMSRQTLFARRSDQEGNGAMPGDELSASRQQTPPPNSPNRARHLPSIHVNRSIFSAVVNSSAENVTCRLQSGYHRPRSERSPAASRLWSAGRSTALARVRSIQSGAVPRTPELSQRRPEREEPHRRA